MKTKKYPITPLAFTAMILMIINSPAVLSEMKSSIKLCISVIIPSLFPFMVMSSVFVGNLKNTLPFGLGKVFKKLFGFSSFGTGAFICGILCGYPIGAKCAAQLYRDKKISASEAETLIACANNSGPRFIIGAVGLGMLHSFKLGIFLYVMHILCALTGARILKHRTYIKHEAQFTLAKEKSLTDSICESVSNVLNVCGFVMFFSVINTLLNPVTSHLPTILKNIVLCIIEITNGIKAVTAGKGFIINKLYIIAFALGWSGISVHMQVKSLIRGLELSMRKYYFVKLTEAVLSPLFVFIATGFTDTLFSYISPNTLKWIIILSGITGAFGALFISGKRKKRGKSSLLKLV